MSYIIRTGNLADTPVLREGERGERYTYARILVSDGIPQEDGTFENGPTVGYDVLVRGTQAVNLVDAAEASGNLRIMFAGRYRVTEYTNDKGTFAQHKVSADQVAVSLQGQAVRAESTRQAAQEDGN